MAVCDNHIGHRGSRAPARARGALYLSSGRRPRDCARLPCSDRRSCDSQFVSMNGGEINYNNRHMVRWVRATFWCLQAPTIRVRWAGDGSERRKRRSATFRGCRDDDEARRATSDDDRFHHNEGQSGPVNRRRRVSSAGSDGSKASESVRRSLAHPTWLPWFASVSGACRAPGGGLGTRASVGNYE